MPVLTVHGFYYRKLTVQDMPVMLRIIGVNDSFHRDTAVFTYQRIVT